MDCGKTLLVIATILACVTALTCIFAIFAFQISYRADGLRKCQWALWRLCVTPANEGKNCSAFNLGDTIYGSGDNWCSDHDRKKFFDLNWVTIALYALGSAFSGVVISVCCVEICDCIWYHSVLAKALNITFSCVAATTIVAALVLSTVLYVDASSDFGESVEHRKPNPTSFIKCMNHFCTNISHGGENLASTLVGGYAMGWVAFAFSLSVCITVTFLACCYSD